MKSIDIAVKDLYQLFKDWKPAVFLLAAPVLFTLLFGFMFGGFGNPDSTVDNRLPVKIATEEQTPLTSHLIEYLEGSTVLRVESVVETTKLDQLKQAVADNNFAAVLVIPEGFSDQLQSTGKVMLDVILKENTTAGMTVLQEIQAISSRVQTAANAAALTVTVYSQTAGEVETSTEDSLFSAAFEEALNAWDTPPVTALKTQTAPDGVRRPQKRMPLLKRCRDDGPVCHRRVDGGSDHHRSGTQVRCF